MIPCLYLLGPSWCHFRRLCGRVLDPLSYVQLPQHYLCSPAFSIWFSYSETKSSPATESAGFINYVLINRITVPMDINYKMIAINKYKRIILLSYLIQINIYKFIAHHYKTKWRLQCCGVTQKWIFRRVTMQPVTNDHLV